MNNKITCSKIVLYNNVADDTLVRRLNYILQEVLFLLKFNKSPQLRVTKMWDKLFLIEI